MRPPGLSTENNRVHSLLNIGLIYQRRPKRRFKVIVDKHHPNIYQFMDRLKGEQAHTETRIEQLIGGMVPQAMRKKVCS